MSNHDGRSGKETQSAGSPPLGPRETPGETPGTEPPNSGASFLLTSLTPKTAVEGIHDVRNTLSINTNPSIPSRRLTHLSTSSEGDFINSPASSTRQNKPKLYYNFDWGAREIEEAKSSPATDSPQEGEDFAAPGRGSSRFRQKEVDPNRDLEGPAIAESSGSKNRRKGNTKNASMSRNRPRGAQNRDNGLAANEEVDMWNGITRDLRKAQERNEKQRALGVQIKALNEKIAREGNSKLPHFFFSFSLTRWVYCCCYDS